ncbi:hypothetical protein ZHAS_00016140 [Anopheles sinensis]|uniref:Uncharacterized protein n=1 Tax=Anopheles sinensis TaxID=74873 RepID=A0A084WCM8_ANOSI|nr:hypothetical protein ZHAS_00016140 [Anopheles sinensis]
MELFTFVYAIDASDRSELAERTERFPRYPVSLEKGSGKCVKVVKIVKRSMGLFPDPPITPKLKKRLFGGGGSQRKSAAAAGGEAGAGGDASASARGGGDGGSVAGGSGGKGRGGKNEDRSGASGSLSKSSTPQQLSTSWEFIRQSGAARLCRQPFSLPVGIRQPHKEMTISHGFTCEVYVSPGAELFPPLRRPVPNGPPASLRASPLLEGTTRGG